jgi:hypothetical protein
MVSEIEIERMFTFRELTVDQQNALHSIHVMAGKLAKEINRSIPPQHAQQAILQLAGMVNLCRQGVHTEYNQAEKPILVS